MIPVPALARLPAAATRTRPGITAPGPRALAAVTAVLCLLAPLAVSPGTGLAAQGTSPAARAGEVASMLDLALTEYRDAVADGEVINEMEYAETREFTTEAALLFRDLDGSGSDRGLEVAAAIDSLLAIVDRRGPVESFEELTSRVNRSLAENWGAITVPEPTRPPSAARGAGLYRQACAACHGPAGRGDGWAADGMEPPPADLASELRRLEATPSRDYQVTLYGVPQTAMPASRDWLSEDEAWDLVAYLQALRYGAAEVAEGKALALGDGDGGRLAGRLRIWSSPAATARLTDPALAARVRARWSEAGPPGVTDTLTDEQVRSVVAYLRSLLGTPATGVPAADRSVVLAEAVAEADSLAAAATELFRSGRRDEARRLALRAYGSFEGVEPELRTRAPGLVRDLEAAFAELRGATNGAMAGVAGERVHRLLARAGDELTSSASVWSVGTQSFVTILREGFEAILIIGAILTFLVKTGHDERKRDVYWGVGAALLASLATAVLMEWALTVTPASREALEGGVMLLAVVVLFSVSYWLVSKLEHERWEAYLRTKMQGALGAGSGLALAGVAFLAVYREGFETVLFYKAILSHAEAGLFPAGAGFVVGCLALAVIYVLFTRYGVRVPMRSFFAGTSALLYAMAVIFAGSGVRELQAAGVIGTTLVPGAPRLSLLGIYPTVETLAAQGILIVLLIGALWWTFRPVPVRTESGARA